jgi:hypothetical protein
MKMKLSPEAMNNAVSGVDGLIGKIPKRTQQTIKNLFMLTIFCLVGGGIVLGVIWGKQAAEIKSAPIIEHTNDAFDLDIKRERAEGNFSMLDTEMINEMKKMEIDKIQFPSRTSMEPEVDKGIIEPESGRKVKGSPDVKIQDPLFEGDYKKRPAIESDVRSVEKRTRASSEDRESVLDNEKKDIGPIPERESGLQQEPRKRESGVRRLEKKAAPILEDRESGIDTGEKKIAPLRERESTRQKDIRGSDPDVRPLQKKRPARGSDIRSPGPKQHDEGIIGE